MKTIALFISTLLITIATSVFAQENDPVDESGKPASAEVQVSQANDEHLLDKIQKETESISAMKPFFFIANIIESRIELKKLEKESIAAARSRELDTR